VLASLNRVARQAYPLVNLEEWTHGSLSFASEPQVRTREERGGRISFRTEPSPGSATEPAPAVPRAGATASPTPSAQIRRYPVTRLRLELHYGAEKPASLPLIVAPSSGG
jgi:hypothetical protein